MPRAPSALLVCHSRADHCVRARWAHATGFFYSERLNDKEAPLPPRTQPPMRDSLLTPAADRAPPTPSGATKIATLRLVPGTSAREWGDGKHPRWLSPRYLNLPTEPRFLSLPPPWGLESALLFCKQHGLVQEHCNELLAFVLKRFLNSLSSAGKR